MSTIKIVEQKRLNGHAIRWDGLNSADLVTLVGERFLGTEGSKALVLVDDMKRGAQRVIHVAQGDDVVLWEGVASPFVYSGDCFEAEVDVIEG